MDILVLEDDRLLGEVLRDALTEAGHRVTLTHDNDTAIDRLATRPFGLLVADLMIGPDTSIPVLDFARFLRPEAEIILITGSRLFPNGEMHFGIADIAYRLQKPLSVADLTALAAHIERTARKGSPPSQAALAGAG